MNDISTTLEYLKQGVKPHERHNYRLRGWRLGVWVFSKYLFYSVLITIAVLICLLLT